MEDEVVILVVILFSFLDVYYLHNNIPFSPPFFFGLIHHFPSPIPFLMYSHATPRAHVTVRRHAPAPHDAANWATTTFARTPTASQASTPILSAQSSYSSCSSPSTA
eukprot:PhM_4_TR10312/c0_g1_i1/m.71334